MKNPENCGLLRTYDGAGDFLKRKIIHAFGAHTCPGKKRDPAMPKRKVAGYPADPKIWQKGHKW